MDLSSPGADLFGVNEAAALRVLSRQGRAVSGRDVARLAGLSPSSMRRALLRLERIGLVSAEESSHARLYTLRREHVLWEPVEQVLITPGKVRQTVAQIVTDRLGERATVALFGSVARGDSTADSDVDLALVVEDGVGAGERDDLVDDLVVRVQALTGNVAQVFTVDRAGLAAMARSGDPLLVSWQKDAVTLSGPDLRRLIREAGGGREAKSDDAADASPAVGAAP